MRAIPASAACLSAPVCPVLRGPPAQPPGAAQQPQHVRPQRTVPVLAGLGLLSVQRAAHASRAAPPRTSARAYSSIATSPSSRGVLVRRRRRQSRVSAADTSASTGPRRAHRPVQGVQSARTPSCGAELGASRGLAALSLVGGGRSTRPPPPWPCLLASRASLSSPVESLCASVAPTLDKLPPQRPPPVRVPPPVPRPSRAAPVPHADLGRPPGPSRTGRHAWCLSVRSQLSRCLFTGARLTCGPGLAPRRCRHASALSCGARESRSRRPGGPRPPICSSSSTIGPPFSWPLRCPTIRPRPSEPAQLSPPSLISRALTGHRRGTPPITAAAFCQRCDRLQHRAHPRGVDLASPLAPSSEPPGLPRGRGSRSAVDHGTLGRPCS